MDFKELLMNLRARYIHDQVYREVLPDFPNTAPVRYRMVFSGRVQGVGFRYETQLLAQRLGLTGFCKNLEHGHVLAELQGPRSKLDYYINFMNHRQRIRIDRQTVTEIPVIPGETGFDSGEEE